jgi:hypothetical protein
MHENKSEADEEVAGGGKPAATAAAEEALDTVPLQPGYHRVEQFTCSKSPRVQAFLRADPDRLIRSNYTKVFIYPNPDDACHVWAYYTLSAAVVERRLTGSQLQKRLPGGIPIPVVRIGYMGRDDNAPRGLGAGLIVDAARRVTRITDLGIWGLTLDAENEELATKFYARVGFKRARQAASEDAPPLLMYGPLSAFLL